MNGLLGINFHNKIIFPFCFDVFVFNPVNIRITRNHKGKEDASTTWDTIDITDIIYAIVRILLWMDMYYVLLIR